MLQFGLLTLAMFQSVAAAEFTRGPEPSWVVPVAPGLVADALRPQASGAFWLLSDVQVRHAGGTHAEYYHYASTALNAEGLQQVANLEIGFNPAYQQLVLHRIDVHRDGMVKSHLVGAKVRILQRETELERRVFDGGKTANVFLEDIRVGDVVEYAFSVEGQNPVFGGRDAGRLPLQFGAPVGRVHVRLLHDDAPRLATYHGAPEPARTRAGALQVLTWDRRDVAGLPVEQDEPSWYDGRAALEWSEYSDWDAVVDWARPLYAPSTELGDTLTAEIARIGREHAKSAERVTAVLRFVQSEVRYLGISIGTSSHAPHPPALVHERRFGDCKDKALLMVSMLQALDIEATPALVHTALRRGLAQRLPSPHQFDHVLVHVVVDGEQYWLDPTLPTQRAQLSALAQADYDLALRVAAGSDTLVPMDGSKVQPVVVETRFDASAGLEKPVSYTVVTTMLGARADGFRANLASEGLESLQKQYLNFYAGYYPHLTQATPLAIEDDEPGNRVILTERYSISNFAQPDGDSGRRNASVFTPDIEGALAGPSETTRRAPLWRPHPHDTTVVTEVLLPEQFRLKREHAVVDDPTFHYERLIEPRPNGVRITDRYQSRTDEIPASDVARVAQKLVQARSTLAYKLSWMPDNATGAGNEESSVRASTLDHFNWLLAVVALFTLTGAGWAARRAWAWDPAPLRAAQPDDPVGLGGWLVLLGFGLCLTPALTAWNLWQGRDIFTTSTWHALTSFGEPAYHALWAPILLFELVSGLAFIVLALLVMALFFSRRSSAPRFHVALLVGAAAQIMLGTLLLSQIPEAASTDDGRDTVRALIGAVIWSTYLLRSRRVRGTFTRRRVPAVVGVAKPPAVSDASLVEVT